MFGLSFAKLLSNRIVVLEERKKCSVVILRCRAAPRDWLLRIFVKMYKRLESSYS